MHKFEKPIKPEEDKRPDRTYQLYDLDSGKVIYKAKAKDGGLMLEEYLKVFENKQLPSTCEIVDNVEKYMWTVK